MVPVSLKTRLEEEISRISGTTSVIHSSEPVGGGCINRSFRLRTNAGDYFVKTNDAGLFPRMFETEMLGLNLLSETREIKVPHSYYCDKTDHIAFLIMEYIDSGTPVKNFWELFGQSLSRLHKHNSEFFGLDHDNYIGSLQQSNRQQRDWVPFFVEERLEPLISLARDHNEIDQRTTQVFSLLFNKLDQLFPSEPAALLHGDLWNGNYMVAPDGLPCLIDPAVYYGHREMDIAMTKLFGGFSPEFYNVYYESFPLETGWNDRIDLCNLYPLLVHLNLFGRSYLSSIQSILGRYV